MDEVWSSVFSSEEGDIVACGAGSHPTFHVERKRWADEASESGTSTLGSDVHSCAGDAPVNKKNTVCSSTSHQGSRLPGHKYDFLPMDGGAGQLCKPCFEITQHGGKEIKQKHFKKMVRRHFGSVSSPFSVECNEILVLHSGRKGIHFERVSSDRECDRNRPSISTVSSCFSSVLKTCIFRLSDYQKQVASVA